MSNPYVHPTVRAAVIRRDGMACVYCGVEVMQDVGPHPQLLTIDHVIPHAQGGAGDIDNLCVACSRCNARKGTRSITAFRLIPAYCPPRVPSRVPPGPVGAHAGPQEIARLLGVSRQRVTQLMARDDFPAPVVVLAMGKVWHTDDIVKWAETTGRAIADAERTKAPPQPGG